VQAYSFTSAPIAKALVDARKRGVRIVAVLDKSQRREKYIAAEEKNAENLLILKGNRALAERLQSEEEWFISGLFSREFCCCHAA